MEWTPVKDSDPKCNGRYWITVAGYRNRFASPKSEPEYRETVATAFWLDGRWHSMSCAIDWGQKIIAYQPYITPKAYHDTSRCKCRLCCGDGQIGDKICWRCGGRGDEAVDGSDVVHKMTPEMRKEYGLK